MLPPSLPLLTALLACSLLSAPLISAAPARRAPTARTATVKNGTYSALALPSFDQEVFLGVPFAQPPVGDLRLRRPVSLNATFEGTRALVTRVPQCAGYGSDNYGYELSEDCLYMNVLRPAGTVEGDELPVAVWIHGGGFHQGGINTAAYNGSWIVQRSVAMDKPIIFINVAYRLGMYGFLNSNQSHAEGVQNLGFHDQRLALEWVNQNIRAFGGDPTKVTLWGESAGAMSVSAQLLAYGESSSNLFRAAILQSGAPTTESFVPTTSTDAFYTQILANVSCASVPDALQCLRSTPFEALNQTIAFHAWFSAIDGSFVRQSPTAQLAAGAFAHVPLLLGANTDEGTYFATYGIDTDDELRAALRVQFPAITNGSVERMLELYPDDNMLGSPYGTGDGYLATGRQDKRSCAITGDTEMIGPRRHFAEVASKKQDKVYSYRFNQPGTYTQDTIDKGVTHIQDVNYVFGNPTNNRTGDAELSRYMTSAWVAFVAELDPNAHGLEGEPEWPRYGDGAKNVVLQRQGRWLEEDAWRADGIRFVNSLGAELGK